MPSTSVAILAIDASTERCSVALLRGSECLHEHCETPRAHAKVLLPMVDRLLGQAGIALKDLDALAVTRGPGSFTGIRICISVAQGLAFGAGLHTFSCDSLRVLAWGLRRQVPSARWLLPCLDARMGELYWALYQVGHTGQLEERIPPRVSAPEAVLETLAAYPQADLHGAGHGWALDALRAALPEDRCHPSLLPEAQSLATLCEQALRDGRATLTPPDAVLEPLYLRNEVTWEKRTRVRDVPLV